MTTLPSGTQVDEVAAGIFRISTGVAGVTGPAGFTYNQYLILDEAPLLFHTGPRRMFGVVRAAVAHVMPVERLRFISFSHFEADECGSLNDWLAAAPASVPVCGQTAARVSIHDFADRPPMALQDGETLELGSHTVQWLDTPHLPHGWDCGCLAERSTEMLLCGDLFAQGGMHHPALTEADIIGPSEALRRSLDFYAHITGAPALLDKLALLQPKVLGCMHGSAWRGNAAELLRTLGRLIT